MAVIYIFNNAGEGFSVDFTFIEFEVELTIDELNCYVAILPAKFIDPTKYCVSMSMLY